MRFIFLFICVVIFLFLLILVWRMIFCWVLMKRVCVWLRGVRKVSCCLLMVRLLRWCSRFWNFVVSIFVNMNRFRFFLRF